MLTTTEPLPPDATPQDRGTSTISQSTIMLGIGAASLVFGIAIAAIFGGGGVILLIAGILIALGASGLLLLAVRPYLDIGPSDTPATPHRVHELQLAPEPYRATEPYRAPEMDLSDLAGPVMSMRERLVTLLTGVVDKVDHRGATVALLARARLPLRSGELVSLTIGGGVALAGLIWLITAQPILALAGFLSAPLGARGALAVRIRNREIAMEEGLPDAVSMVAASMNGGHSFQRSIQITSQEMSGPVAEEFARVIQEVRLGHNMVEALQRMAERVQLDSVDLLVNAVRIQHYLGGSMAELLHTIAESIRARQELHREVRVLTAEGRLSAWLLGALPLLLLLLISGISPNYSDPLFRGWGFVWLAGCAASVSLGVFWIRKMSEIEI